MSSNIHVSPDNPYGQVTIPRAKLHLSDDSTVIANPGAVNINELNPYSASSSSPPPYVVKEAGGEEAGGGFVCCARCRRRK